MVLVDLLRRPDYLDRHERRIERRLARARPRHPW
jgi:hypothetical protein